MTNLSDFSADERARITDTVGAVGIAAINADGIPGPVAMVKESVALVTAVEKSQGHQNDFVRSVADAVVERGDSGAKSARPSARGDREHGGQEGREVKAIADTEASIALVRERGTQDDVDAYGELLLRVATYIVDASPSREGGLFGKKVQVSAAEQAFVDRLTATIKA